MITKYVSLAIVLLLPLISRADEKVVIDLKVPLTETADLTPAQVGARLFLLKSDWATVSEFGEDVAVWLTEYERKKNIIGQQVISLSLEIREPSSLRTGNLIKKHRITVRYWPTSFDDKKFNQKILNDLEKISKNLRQEAYYLGEKIEARLRSSLK